VENTEVLDESKESEIDTTGFQEEIIEFQYTNNK